MTKYLLSILMCFSVVALHAQQNIVDELQTVRPGQGRVIIHQNAAISALIGKRFISSAKSETQHVLRARGFRVQVYAGNNSRLARNEATDIANKIKETFPDMPVYTYFQPPRWLCRVGDYRSIEEAHVAMRKLRDTGMFKEVAIVREQINIPLE